MNISPLDLCDLVGNLPSDGASISRCMWLWTMTAPGRNGRSGVSNGNKQTFVHGDSQRQPSTQSRGSATVAATSRNRP